MPDKFSGVEHKYACVLCVCVSKRNHIALRDQMKRKQRQEFMSFSNLLSSLKNKMKMANCTENKLNLSHEMRCGCTVSKKLRAKREKNSLVETMAKDGNGKE